MENKQAVDSCRPQGVKVGDGNDGGEPASAISCMTEEKQKQLKERLYHTLERITPKEPKLTYEENADIREAVNCGIKDLFDLGCMVAYKAISPRFTRVALSYRDKDGRTTLEDLLQELWVVILSDIKRYDPAYDLLTFFTPRVNKAFIETKYKGKGIGMTTYFQSVGITINRAIREINKRGYDNPSPQDIKDQIWLDSDGKKTVSVTTIKRYLDSEISVSTLDGKENTVYSSDDKYDNPEKGTIKREESILFKKTLDSMSPVYRCVIETEMACLDKNEDISNEKKLIPIIQGNVAYNLNKLDTMKLIRSAHTEFKYQYLRNTGGLNSKKQAAGDEYNPQSRLKYVNMPQLPTQEEDEILADEIIYDISVLDSPVQRTGTGCIVDARSFSEDGI